jgi:hypothetical protein
MNENDKMIFEYIKEKAEKDKVLWHESQKDHNTSLSPEREEAIIERMFLVHFTKRYLEQEKEIESLKMQRDIAREAPFYECPHCRERVRLR